MKTLKLLTLFLTFALIQTTNAQKIVEFSQYKIEKDKYDKPTLIIKPHTSVENADAKYDRNTGVYGVLICYKLDGEQKVARQDMTTKLKRDGVFTFTLSYSANSKVSGVSVEYFNMQDMPKEKWPKKESCF